MERAETAEASVLSQSLFDYRIPSGDDLISRCAALGEWVDGARELGLLPFIRTHLTAPDVRTEVMDFGGHRYRGLNLASQDYLGLARHPLVMERAAAACLQHGTHSAGSEPMGGGMGETLLLERELADFLGAPRHVVLFPTGWGAGYGAIKALVRPGDHVVIDALAHDCLQHGAHASTPNVLPFAHNDMTSLAKRLARVRRSSPDAAVLVVTESLFSMDSDHPDFLEITRLCREHSAALLVDVAHDLGVLGPGGQGVLAEQEVADQVDVIVGSFSKTFACLGGFVATRSKPASYYVRGFSGTYTFSNFLMPAQVAAVRAALEIVRSEEGDRLRAEVMARSATLRHELLEHGLDVGGRLSPIVLPMLGSEPVTRLTQRRCFQKGLIVNGIEFPACRRGAARLRLQVTPRHQDDDLREAARIIAEAVAWSRREAAAILG